VVNSAAVFSSVYFFCKSTLFYLLSIQLSAFSSPPDIHLQQPAMLFTKTFLLTLTAFVAGTAAAPAKTPELHVREQHCMSICQAKKVLNKVLTLLFAAFQVQSPVDGYVFVPGSSSCGCGVFNLRALDGQQGGEYFVQATLIDHNSNNSTIILPATKFDGFVVDKQIALASANFNPGAYGTPSLSQQHFTRTRG